MIHNSHYYESEALHALEQSKERTLDEGTKDRWADRAQTLATLALAAATVEAK